MISGWPPQLYFVVECCRVVVAQVDKVQGKVGEEVVVRRMVHKKQNVIMHTTLFEYLFTVGCDY